MKTCRKFTPEEVETIKELYKDHFDYEIAEIINHTQKSVNAKIQSLGLTDRIPSSTLRKMRNWKRCEDEFGIPIKDLLYELHWKLNLPVRNGMDNALKTNPKSVTLWMDELGVPHRSISEDNHRRYSTMTEEQIKAQTKAANEHVRGNGQPKNIGRIGWCIGLTKNDHPGIKASSEKHMGENNPMWNKRREKSPRWTGADLYWKHRDWFEIRELIKKRDGYKCRDCGMDEETALNEYSTPLQVHHIIPYRECKEHDPENLITLCSSCHSKADGNLSGDHKRRPKKSPELKESGQAQSTIFQF